MEPGLAISQIRRKENYLTHWQEAQWIGPSALKRKQAAHTLCTQPAVIATLLHSEQKSYSDVFLK